QDTLARLDPEAAAELAPGMAAGVDLLGEDRPRSELTAGLEGEDHAAGRGTRDEVDRRAAGIAPRDPEASGPEAAQRAGPAEERLGPFRDGAAGRGLERGFEGGHRPRSVGGADVRP